MGVRPPLRQYLRDVVARREFLTVLAASKAKAANENTYLGQIWSVLTPALNSLVYVLIFGIMLKTRAGMDNVIGFIVVGTFMYGYFSTSVTDSAKSIRSSIKLVQSLNFPRILMPMATALKDLMVLVPGLAVMFLIAQASVATTQGVDSLHPERWILLVPAVLLLALFSSGLGFILARMCSRMPDLVKLLPFIFRVGMYASGVIFAIQHQLAESTLRFVLEHQPVAVYLNLARQAMLSERSIPLDWRFWLEGLVWGVGIFVIGVIVFWRDEARYGRD